MNDPDRYRLTMDLAVAEGVETQDQLSFLSSHACDAIQGFHVSRPLTPDRFAEFVRDRVVVEPIITTV